MSPFSRAWFQCPDCGRRCAVLFGVSRRGNFACRTCQRLAYSSETESPLGHLGHRGYDRSRVKGTTVTTS